MELGDLVRNGDYHDCFSLETLLQNNLETKNRNSNYCPKAERIVVRYIPGTIPFTC